MGEVWVELWHNLRMKPALAFQTVRLWPLALFSLIVACAQTETSVNHTTSVPPSAQIADVVRVIDGDTIEVNISGAVHTVRYIGVDTPETKHPTRGVEAYGPEASEKNRQLVKDKSVYLERDVSETDRYDRLLRYVYVDDLMVNAVLVEEGYAQASMFPPDVKYADLFMNLQREAREAGRGIWSAKVMGSGVIAEGACDSAYPSLCIPPPPPDLNCDDISHRSFKVLSPDPHRFDGDKDGVGCES